MPRIFWNVRNPHVKTMKASLKNTAILIAASILTVVFITSCGTVRGFGRDVEHVGDSIEDSAR